MAFIPVKLILERAERYGADSDSALLTELLYVGEFITKLTVAAFVAAIEDDRENHRYRVLHALVRSDGIGDWSRALDELLSGPTTQQMSNAFFDVRRVFTERVGKGYWQYDLVRLLNDILAGVTEIAPSFPDKVALRSWFSTFAEIRNKTRGHGAPTPALCAKIVPSLRNSIDLLAENNPIFSLPWAYLHRNMSGKYKVVGLGGEIESFSKLKSAAAATGDNYPDGIYLYAGRYRRVELVSSDLNASDFFVPNGAFRNGTYELHSLITDSRLKGDAGPYMAPASERPSSETEGNSQLDVVGHVFTNMPKISHVYIPRPDLEAEIRSVLKNDRHPIVTLVGRGGIGKTSLALSTLREIAKPDRYEVIVWFSARDIDLMVSGAKPVRPRVVTDKEIAEQYRELVGISSQGPAGKIDVTKMMAEHLHNSPNGPTLFVFDNFETIRSPVDLFQWIDTNIRLPNKALITTRFRDFKADYPIEVSGMEQHEAEALVSQTAAGLGISPLINQKETEVLVEESDGHPYVIKIMLGEIANAGKFSKPSNLLARKEELLDALFERTYATLSPLASRIFLTLCGWRSLVPQLAIEAVLLRHGNEFTDPAKSIDQLLRVSLVERTVAKDGSDFMEIPLTAAIFGRRKLEVSPERAVIENDIRFLQDLGATAASGLKDGIRPRVETFFKKAAQRISDGKANFLELQPIFEFFARAYPPAWLLLSELEQENGGADGIGRSAECVRRFLESQPPTDQSRAAWQRLVALYRSMNDVIGGCSAFLKAAEAEGNPPLNEISSMASWLNSATELMSAMDVYERRTLFAPMATLMEAQIAEASATDLSRLSWLHLHSGSTDRALEVAELGLARDKQNVYCQRLVNKLTETSWSHA